ncbi:MAG: invasion associated locus B family protein [Methyloceanibacter sp.]
MRWYAYFFLPLFLASSFSQSASASDVWEKRCGLSINASRGCVLIQSVVAEGSTEIGGSLLVHPIVSENKDGAGVALRVAVPYGVIRTRRVVFLADGARITSSPYADCNEREGCFAELNPSNELFTKLLSAKTLEAVYQVDERHAEGLPFEIADLKQKLDQLKTSLNIPAKSLLVARIRYVAPNGKGECEEATEEQTFEIGENVDRRLDTTEWFRGILGKVKTCRRDDLNILYFAFGKEIHRRQIELTVSDLRGKILAAKRETAQSVSLTERHQY